MPSKILLDIKLLYQFFVFKTLLAFEYYDVFE